MTRKLVTAALALALFALVLIPSLKAQKPTPHVTSLRVYLFDCGSIHGENPLTYGLNKGDVKDSSMVVPCYLIVHPKGTMLWDAGVIPDSAFHGDKPVTQSDGGDTMTVSHPLVPQLEALGYGPRNITYVAFSHYHSDHVANANAFAGSTWLVHPTERAAMFAAPKKDQAAYDQLRHSKTVLLPQTDYDVFGDGTVIIKYTPGHTEGHQVLALKLPKTGPVLIGGDLWHYVAERTATKPPDDEANKDQTMRSRVAIEAYLKQSGAQLWVEHDPVTFHRLKKAPDYIE